MNYTATLLGRHNLQVYSAFALKFLQYSFEITLRICIINRPSGDFAIPKYSFHLSLPVQAVCVNSGSGETRVPTLKLLQDVDMEHSVERRYEK
jgi:hypothetical protein